MTADAIRYKYENFGELIGNPIHDMIFKGRLPFNDTYVVDVDETSEEHAVDFKG